MTEQQVDNLFDPENFVTSSALNGRRGTIVKAQGIRTNYGGKSAEDVTVVEVVVVSPDLEKPRRNLISVGGTLKPSKSPNGPPDTTGAFLTGGRLDKNSNTAKFLSDLKAAGFPIARMATEGFDAWVGADITWKAWERKISKTETKVYDHPSEFHGFVDAGTLAALQAQVAGKEGEAPGGVSVAEAAALQTSSAGEAAGDEELKATVSAALISALQAAGSEGIPKGQLSMRLNPALAGLPPAKRTQGLFLIMQAGFLASVPGVVFDTKTVRLSVTPEIAQAAA